MNTDTVQIDAAGVINTTAAALDMRYGGVNTPTGGGSGGGHGAGGGQGHGQEIVGAPHGNLYVPAEFGSGGGTGGGANNDIYCFPHGVSASGAGGGIIQLLAASSVEIDGDLFADGGDAFGPRAGGGAGGSVYISTTTLRGQGNLLARGGSVPSGSNCTGGGGAGGRIAVHYTSKVFTGAVLAQGGASSYECGGAGTILWRNKTDSTNSLVVNNYDLCTPLNSMIKYDDLDALKKGHDSFHTWLFDEDDTHSHDFAVVEVSGLAQLAVYSGATYTQTIRIAKTLGDKAGLVHIGPHQVKDISWVINPPLLRVVCSIHCHVSTQLLVFKCDMYGDDGYF